MTNQDLGINFINADEGGLRFRINTNEGEIRRRADTIEDGVHWVSEYGFADTCYLSSDMDFATEECFDTDDGARVFLDQIIDSASKMGVM